MQLMQFFDIPNAILLCNKVGPKPAILLTPAIKIIPMHIFGREENNGRDFLIIQPAKTPSQTSQAMSTTYMGTVSFQSPRPLESPRFASSEP